MVPKQQNRGSRSLLFNGGIVLSFVMPTVRMKLFNYHRLLLSVTYNPHHNFLHGHRRSPLDCLHTLPVRVAVYSEGRLQSSVARIRLFAYTALFLMRWS